MPPKIEFPQIEPQWIFDCVAFVALVDNKPVRCIISMEALFQNYGARTGSEQDCLRAFHEHRRSIEKEAAAIIRFHDMTPEREVVIRASREGTKSNRLLHFIQSSEISKKPEITQMLHDVTVKNVGRFAPHGCDVRVHWDYAGTPDGNLFQVTLEDPETESQTVNWFSLDQLKDPMLVRYRFDSLWAEHLSGRSKKQLEKVRGQREGV